MSTFLPGAASRGLSLDGRLSLRVQHPAVPRLDEQTRLHLRPVGEVKSISGTPTQANR